MRIPRLFIDQPLRCGEPVALDRRTHDHAVKVLRLRSGDRLCLFNGRGGEFAATLATAPDRTLQALVGEFTPDRTESPLTVRLLQGISRGERMDYTLQKAVELGVGEIVPLATERTVLRLTGEREARRLAHWRGVVLAACEQSGRTRLPPVAKPRPLAAQLAQPLDGAGVLLDPRAGQALMQTGPYQGAVNVLIGPEGGLSPSEVTAAQAAGYIGVRIGPRVLRTETAAVVVLALLQALGGDFGS